LFFTACSVADILSESIFAIIKGFHVNALASNSCNF